MREVFPETLTEGNRHASHLRHMTYTLSRFRTQNPGTPFRLGGEFLRLDSRAFLKDSHSTIELLGSNEEWLDFQTGDQVSVQVTRVIEGGTEVEICEAVLHVRSARPHRNLDKLHAQKFPQFQQLVRQFFINRGLIELQTPTLVLCPGLEPTLEPFAVDKLYLLTSPEVHLKKALANGWTDIFELKTCFRKGEYSQAHEPEFTMLEWYRAYADLELILADLFALVGDVCGLKTPPRVTTFRELFLQEFGFSLTPQTSAVELRELLRSNSIHYLEDEEFTDLFHRLLIERIEVKLKGMGPVIVRDFPPNMAALARLTPEGWADRFEFYWNGLEIANAFNEVNEPLEQRRRWEFEQVERARIGSTFLPMDVQLIEALEAGMPPSGGIALGVERLYMAMNDVKKIQELKLFPYERER